ncbi:MAG: hypothetical protein ABSG05_00795 [Candidatus Pacearchaeota archaeon]|jgi:choline-glycine betaine transporter
MKASLIIFGVIFLVLGGLFYFVPFQNIQAGVNSNSSSANVTIPVGWAYASAIIGFLLLVIGLASSGPTRVVQGPRGPRGRTAYHRRSTRRRSRRAALPSGTSVTTTTTRTR